MYKPFMFSGVLFIANGKDGVDIYKQNEEKKYRLVKTLGIDELQIAKMTN